MEERNRPEVYRECDYKVKFEEARLLIEKIVVLSQLGLLESNTEFAKLTEGGEPMAPEIVAHFSDDVFQYQVAVNLDPKDNEYLGIAWDYLFTINLQEGEVDDEDHMRTSKSETDVSFAYVFSTKTKTVHRYIIDSVKHGTEAMLPHDGLDLLAAIFEGEDRAVAEDEMMSNLSMVKRYRPDMDEYRPIGLRELTAVYAHLDRICSQDN